jgi:hypothetical protein
MLPMVRESSCFENVLSHQIYMMSRDHYRQGISSRAKAPDVVGVARAERFASTGMKERNGPAAGTGEL